MTTGELGGGIRTRVLVAVATVAALALGRPASPADAPAPVVVESKSALPAGCVSLGEVSGRHGDEPPRPEKAQAEAVREARSKGATHVVTTSAERCGGNSYCYEGVAYRCPVAGGAAAGK